MQRLGSAPVSLGPEERFESGEMVNEHDESDESDEHDEHEHGNLTRCNTVRSRFLQCGRFVLGPRQDHLVAFLLPTLLAILGPKHPIDLDFDDMKLHVVDAVLVSIR